jgi:hypothetical protein
VVNIFVFGVINTLIAVYFIWCKYIYSDGPKADARLIENSVARSYFMIVNY